jgi:hypothetical protein
LVSNSDIAGIKIISVSQLSFNDLSTPIVAVYNTYVIVLAIVFPFLLVLFIVVFIAIKMKNQKRNAVENDDSFHPNKYYEGKDSAVDMKNEITNN